MISPKMSILMVAMSVVGTVAPMAAMATSDPGDVTTTANVIEVPTEQNAITGLNEQTNYAEVNQLAATNVEVDGDCEADDGDVNECGSISRGADAGNIDQSQDLDQTNELETGDANQVARQDINVDSVAIGGPVACCDLDCLRLVPNC